MTGPYVPSVESLKMATPLVGGTFANQDSRSINQGQGKPPPEFDHLVDTGKINMDIIKSWIATRGTELLACKSESLVSFISSLLEDKIVDAKSCQIKLTEFIKHHSTKYVEEDTVKFVKELWNLLIAQCQLQNLEKAEIHQNKSEDNGNSRPYADPVSCPLIAPNIPDGESELNSNHSSTTKNLEKLTEDDGSSKPYADGEIELNSNHSSTTKNCKRSLSPSSERSSSLSPEHISLLRPAKRRKSSPISENDSSNCQPSSQEKSPLKEIEEHEEHFESMMLSWRYLYNYRMACIKSTERNFELDIEKIREAYDRFLQDFPFFVEYWKKYAVHEQNLSYCHKVMEVYERAVAAVPHSVDIWYCYCQFTISTYQDPSIIRRRFERALRYVGANYYSSKLWDLYLEFEDSKQDWQKVASLYKRIFRNPIENLDWYFYCFGNLAAGAADRHALHLLLSPEEVSLFDAINLAHQKSNGAPLNEADKLRWYLSIGKETYQKSKENEPSAVKKETTTPLRLCHPFHLPWNGCRNIVTLLLPEFFSLSIHVKAVAFHTENPGSQCTVMAPIGTRVMKGIFRNVTQQYLEGFCWAGDLKPGDISVSFDGSEESDVTVLIQKHATVPISKTHTLADASCFENMLKTPFTLNGKSVAYMNDLFKKLKAAPTDVDCNMESRTAWVETIRLQPVLTFLSSRLRLYQHLHKHMRNGSAVDRAYFNLQFPSFTVPHSLGFTISQHPLLAEVYWYQKEKQMKKLNLPFKRILQDLLNDIGCYKVSHIIELIRHVDAHAMDHFKALGVATDNLEETDHILDVYFEFLLAIVISGLLKMAPTDPKIKSILEAFKREN